MEDPGRLQRRLVAILAADIVGYSRLIERDEVGTVTRLKTLRAEFINPTIAAHAGNIVRLAGDGAIVEFPSLVEATQCAIDLQRGMAKRNVEIPEHERIVFRIGVNFGDLVVEEDNRHGDGINVAARLEALAEPGGILISEEVARQVEGKVSADLMFQEERILKNIERPARIYKVLLDSAQGEPRKTVPITVSVCPMRILVPAATVAVLTLIAGLLLWWWQPWALRSDPEAADSKQAAVAVSEEPSIAVLPFVNLSADANQEFFVDGLTEDLITDLAKLSGLFVISRNSAFTYKNQTVKIPKVARDLGVRYILEGSVRRSADRIRVNAQLIDAQSDRHLWAERYDRVLTDVFAVQDEIKQRIIAALAIELEASEQAELTGRPTGNVEAYEYYLRGRRAMDVKRETVLQVAQAAFKRAIELDPSFAKAQAALAMTYALDYRVGVFGTWVHPPRRARAKALQLARDAAALDSSLALPELVLAQIELADRAYDEALEHANRAIQREPGDSQTHVAHAMILTAAGDHSEALRAMERALRLDPKPPPSYYNVLGRIQFALRDYEGAIENLELWIKSGGLQDVAMNGFHLPASYAYVGRSDDARTALGYAHRYQSESLNIAMARMDLFYRRAEDREHYIRGLRMAGVPDYAYGFELTSAGDRQLSGFMIKDLMYGHSIKAFNRSARRTAQFDFTPNGQATWVVRPDISDTGPAWIQGDSVCVRFPAITRGVQTCYFVFRNTDDHPTGKQYDYIMVGPEYYYFSLAG